ncbi:ABC transporter permease [Arthrobacter agilis]|uniref:ABC transporter permease n=1 Tax=Arthrobacter agilis TaxID=37921 RepID=UPI000B35C358|nr:ABC transporter permease [Arthrobacter agilis]OUM41411.1 ABC transporter permease [Arthrobacter agilis]PPB46257.1 ABC transporter permease [Arthrobacter agilis]TPV27014.1 ABC transporter permease [Arthrobacter agilis]VDR32841.1 Ribose transport system permease protein rbsC [Arthrobacter agilis]
MSSVPHTSPPPVAKTPPATTTQRTTSPDAPQGDRWHTSLRRIGFWADHAAIIGLVLLVLVFTALNPVFLTLGNVQSILVAASILMVLTVGQAFVILSDGIDLSVASTMTLGVIAFGIAFSQGAGLLVSMLSAVVASALIGLINGILVAKGKITDFIVTLGSLSVASGLALVLSDGKPISVFSVGLVNFSTHGLLIFGFPFVVAAVIAVLAHVLLFRTRFGTHLFATGGSKEAAQATGISTARIKIAVYTISGVLAGIAAIMLIARVGASEPAANTTFLLNSVAAVVLGGVSLTGGKGNIFGPIVGALLLTVLTNGLTLMNVSQFYQPLAVGIVVILAALLSRFQK